ncbi:TlpA disulfide reductase family protein [Pedobacter frigoris]|uniref:TlpA family protein disulfide reductase n=1 Tax=Pedobacter frigoris TaxID=2571272 RepID=UPI002931ACDC|nr:TlpA disulfide reductase family protein [Pedobacter frigoris]
MKTIAYLFVLCMFLACKPGKSNKTSVPGPDVAKDNDIYLTIDSNGFITKNIFLSYFDLYGNSIQHDFNIEGGKIKHLKIKSELPLFLKDPTANQTYYLIYPGEKINIKGQTGDFLNFQSNSTDSIRNHELDFFDALKTFSLSPESRLMADKILSKNLKITGGNLKPSLIPMLYRIAIINKLKDTTRAMEYGNLEYSERMKFLTEYDKQHQVSEKFKTIVAKYFYYDNIGFRLSVIKGKFTKDPNFLNQQQLQRKVAELNCDSCFFIPSYQTAVSDYLRILKKIHKENPVTEIYKDLRISLQGKTADFATFILVKDLMEYQGNGYEVILKQFLKDNRHKEFSDYLTKIEKHKNEVTKDGMSLLQSDDKMISLKSLLEKNKGKVILLDFWASWCSACIADIPYSNKLKTRFAGQPVAFIYLSMDTQVPAWKSSNDQLGLSSSYLVMDNFKSELAKSLKIESIPRYVLIDKAGNIVTKNAPRPTDKELANQIERIIKD